jgi:hypothetical protein
MDETSRGYLLSELDRSEAEFLGTLAPVTEEEANFRPGDGSWTILDCIEHAAVVETTMCGMVRSSYEVLPEPLIRPDFEAKLSRNVVRRGRKVEAPESAHPHSRFATLVEATTHFREVRARTRDYVASCADDLRARTVVHPFVGNITGFECLLMIVGHPLRHAAQIREIRELWLAGATG